MRDLGDAVESFVPAGKIFIFIWFAKIISRALSQPMSNLPLYMSMYFFST